MAANISELCEQRKLTFAQLADQTGLDEGRLHAICLGRWTPAPSERQKIAEALQVSTNDIIWGHKTPVQHIYGSGPG
jgi:transcriptional regulator with XRE-family HTH domain